MLKPRYSKIWYLVGTLLVANLAVWLGVIQVQPAEFLRLEFFDVGQGDAIYLRTVQGNDILIDGGPGETVLSKLGQAMPFFDRTLELVILTHPHADHLSGLVEVLKRYRVKNVLIPPVPAETSATYYAFQDLIIEKKLKVTTAHLGQRIYFDDSTVFDVYHPIWKTFVKLPKNLNDASIVGRISYGKSQIFLTGDASQDVEQLLLQLNLPLDSEILKVGHHGSEQSTNPEFVKNVSPKESVISVGKNAYGHPQAEVLGVLTSAGSQVLRTDQEGDISFAIYPNLVVLQQGK